ncbi:lantibiotic dehydratase [Streptococcus suis]|nr:lantibiotic dehydratase [Streptococcus suis]
MNESMVKNIYYRKTNFPNKEFSKIFQKDFFRMLRTQHFEHSHLQEQAEVIRKTGIEELNRSIQDFPESKNKQQLLKFLHDFYNNRGEVANKYHKISALLPSELITIFDSYFEYQRQILEIEGKIEKLVHRQYLNEKQLLIEGVSRHADFIQNTKMIDKNLYQKVEKLLKTDVEKHNKKQRQLDIFLYNYFARIGAKTSPLGLLGTTGVYGRESFDLKKNIVMSVNSSIILKLFDCIYLNPNYQPSLTFKLNETLIYKDGKYYITVFNDVAGKSLYRNRQELVTLSENESLNGILGLFKEQQVLTGDTLLKYLSQNAQEGYLPKLLENRVLLPADQINIVGNQSISEALLEKLKELSLDLFSDEITEFEKVVDLENEVFSWEAYDQLTEVIHNIVQTYGIEGFNKSTYVSIDMVTSQNDTYLEEQAKVVKANQKIIEDLSKFISIFDISTRSKYLAYEMLKTNYGGEFIPQDAKEISKFLRDLAATLFQRDGYWMESFGYLGTFYNHQIDNQLLALKKNIVQQLLVQDLGDGSDLLISYELLRDSYEQLEKLVGRTHASRGYFLQVSPENKIVFNHIYKGYGVYRRRFNHYLPRENESYGLDGELVDIPMTFGFNANIRESTDKTLHLPLGDLTLTSTKQLTWLDLGFRLSKRSKEIEVFEKATGNIVYPHFLGSLITVALPSLVAVFNSITLNDSIYFDFGELLLRQKLEKGSQEKIVLPRIYFENKNLILSRTKWYITCKKLHAILDKDSSMGIKWLEVVDYFEKEELPLSFFIKDFFENYNQDSELIKTKPLYINFNSFLSFKAFAGLLKKKNKILIEETLPECIDAETDTITELIFETDD